MQIALVYNERPKNLDRHDPKLEEFVEGDEWKTIEAIGKAVEGNGHQVSYYPIDATIYSRLEKSKPNIDILFNLSEGVSRGPNREAHIPMLAEILGIPCTGPGALSAALILNKARAKEIWSHHGIRTAKWQLFKTDKDLLNKNLTYPLLVKPNGEGSGIGIKSNSIVKNAQELKKVVSNLINKYHEAALVEEYLPGREFTVALVGNGKTLTTLPIIEVNFDIFPKGAPRIDTLEAKYVYGVTGLAPMHETEFCPANLTKKLEKEINHLSIQAFKSIGCHDFARVDLRMDDKDNVYVMEINHPPGMMSDPFESSFFTIAARTHGWDFNTLIGKILSAAITRLGL